MCQELISVMFCPRKLGQFQAGEMYMNKSERKLCQFEAVKCT